jgi:hypothetical protein
MKSTELVLFGEQTYILRAALRPNPIALPVHLSRLIAASRGGQSEHRYDSQRSRRFGLLGCTWYTDAERANAGLRAVSAVPSETRIGIHWRCETTT